MADAKIRFWPFALASVGTGYWSDALFSYAEANQQFSGQGCLLKLLDSRSWYVLTLFSIGSLAYGLWAEIGEILCNSFKAIASLMA